MTAEAGAVPAAVRPQFFQAAWVVEDLKAAMLRWNIVGVGPFYHVPHVQVEDLTHRGKASAVDFSIALAQAGPLQIELIQQHNQASSIYRDIYPAGHGGFHHVCLLTTDFDGEVGRYASEGSQVAMSGVFGGARFAYLDTRQSIGCITEMLEETPIVRGLFDRIAGSSVQWDGSTVPLSL